MLQSLIPLAHIIAIGFGTFYLVNSLLSREDWLGWQFYTAFVGVNVAAFLTGWYLLFLLFVVGLLLSVFPQRAATKIAAFAFLLPVLPDLEYQLVAGGTPLLVITWSRLLIIVLLLPLMVSAFRARPMLHFPMDKYFLLFFAVLAVLSFRDTTVTAALRTVIYLFLDIIVPYFVISRHLRNASEIRATLLALLSGLVFCGAINVFEFVRNWDAYGVMIRELTGDRGFRPSYRLEMRRVGGPLQRPSISSFGMTVGIAILWAFSTRLRNRRLTLVVLAVLVAGLFLTFSRGSWVSAAFIGIAYLLTINFKRFLKVGVGLLILAIPLSQLDMTQDVLSILPFAADESVEAGRTVAYRETLFETTWKVAQENPIFGSTRYEEHPYLDALRQHSGLLDIVNHYLLLLLRYGFAGLIPFVIIFLSTFLLLARLHGNVSREQYDFDHRVFARAFILSMTGMLAAIATTSALGRVGLYLWVLVALSAAASELASPQQPTTKALWREVK